MSKTVRRPALRRFYAYAGPGMYGCLSVGVHAARAIAASAGKPLVGIHHMVCLPSMLFETVPNLTCP
jgi:tRNA A37 threonylcarbamoyltransferase TsaD